MPFHKGNVPSLTEIVFEQDQLDDVSEIFKALTTQTEYAVTLLEVAQSSVVSRSVKMTTPTASLELTVPHSPQVKVDVFQPVMAVKFVMNESARIISFTMDP